MKKQTEILITEIIPQAEIETFVREKNAGSPDLLIGGNAVINSIGNAIVREYFSDKNGYGKAIHSHLSAINNFEGSDGKEGKKYLLYWRIKRDGKQICFPIIQFLEPSGNDLNYYTVDQNGNMYPTRFLNEGKTMELGLSCVDEKTKATINLLEKYDFVHQGEIAPDELKVALKIGPPVYHPDSDSKSIGIKGLSWQLEMHTATKILPQYVIEDLKLLKM